MRACFLVLAGLIALSEQHVATIDFCDDVDQTMCTVKEVRIDPCLYQSKSCVFKKAKNITLEFDFVPNFSAGNLKTGVYYPQGGVDLPFASFGSDDACLYTSCPAVAGTQQLYRYTLYLGKKLPTGLFKIKWLVWNDDNTNERCCFTTSIILKK